MAKKKIGKYHNTTKKVAKYTVPQFFNTKWKRDVIPKPPLCMSKLRANKTEITIKSLLMKISHRQVIFDSDKISNIHWRGSLIIKKK